MKQIILNPVQTKFGLISIETLIDQRSEEDRIKIYDSDDRYLDYFSVEALYESACEMETTLEEEYATRLWQIRNAETIDDLIATITVDAVDWSDNPLVFAKILDIRHKDKEELFHKIVNNDYVNRIGKYYILMGE